MYVLTYAIEGFQNIDEQMFMQCCTFIRNKINYMHYKSGNKG
jgi:hypothetical protein